MKIKKSELRQLIREAMTRITEDEMTAWKNGDWGYVAGDKEVQKETHEMDVAPVQPVQSTDDSQRFLHGYEEGHPHDDEGYMFKSNLYSMKEMAEEVCELVKPEDQLPGWVQDLLAVAHENLSHVHRYLTGDEALRQYAQHPHMKESKLNEGHNRVTKEEMDAWMRGDWGFVSEENES